MSRWAAVVTLLAMILAGCGTTLSDSERAARRAAEDGRGAGVAAGGGSAGQSSGTGTGGAVGGDTTAGAPGPSAAGAPTGPGAASGAPAGGPASPVASPGAAACAGGGATDVGVTATTITLGNVGQLSGPVPGLSETAVKGAQAYLNLVNSRGGVCGRRVELIVADDRSEAGENAAQYRRLRDKVFAFVGSFSAVDGGSVSALTGTNVPAISVATDPGVSKLSNHFSPSPVDGGITPQRYRYMVSQGATKVALVVVGVAAARHNADFEEGNMRAAGMQVVLRQEVSVTQFSFAGAARAVANSGAQAMLFLHTADASAAMASELAKIRYKPKFPYYIVAYGSNFLESAGAAAEGAATPLTFAPFEDRASNTAVDEFLTWFARTAPGLRPDRFAVDSWSGARLLFDAVAGLSGPLKRDAVLARLRATGDWDAGGLETRSNIAAKKPSGCFVLVRVIGGRWVREHPKGTTAFAC